MCVVGTGQANAQQLRSLGRSLGLLALLRGKLVAIVPGPPLIVGELLNHAYARARRAWTEQSDQLYAELAKHQARLGARYLNVNLGSTSTFAVDPEDARRRLPRIISTLQATTTTPLGFDSTDLELQRIALTHYDRTRSPAPLLNSIAKTRPHLGAWFALIERFKPKVIVMAADGLMGSETSVNSTEAALDTCLRFAQELQHAGLTPDDIFFDPGLGVLGHDPLGLIPRSLELLKKLSEAPELRGTHRIVGLSNLTACTPKALRAEAQRAYLEQALPLGLDCILANPETPAARAAQRSFHLRA